MAFVTLDGYFDHARHEPLALTRYFGMDLDRPLVIGAWQTRSVYVNDLRVQNGRPPTTGYSIVERAIPGLRLALHAPDGGLTSAPDGGRNSASALLLMEPEGLEGRPHAVGGGWTPQGSGVMFYIARNNTTDGTGRWCKYLCADVGVNVNTKHN
jgi:hypothetical protein